jgi:hypothetical protein
VAQFGARPRSSKRAALPTLSGVKRRPRNTVLLLVQPLHALNLVFRRVKEIVGENVQEELVPAEPPSPA